MWPNDVIPNQGLGRVNVPLAFEVTQTGIAVPPTVSGMSFNAGSANAPYASMIGRNIDDVAIQATVEGTGAVTATVQIEVSNDTKGWLVDSTATLVLSGTNISSKSFTSPAPWTYWRVNVTAISGTNAKVTVTVGG